MWFVLAPLAQHQVPPFRAWSAGRSAGVSLTAGMADWRCRKVAVWLAG